MQAIDLADAAHVVHRWWITGVPGELGHAVVGLGQLADGRWFAARAGRGWAGAWVARDERQACDAVEAWMRRRGGHQAWREIRPGEPVVDADGKVSA
jgi:hypothetical protein